MKKYVFLLLIVFASSSVYCENDSDGGGVSLEIATGTMVNAQLHFLSPPAGIIRVGLGLKASFIALETLEISGKIIFNIIQDKFSIYISPSTFIIPAMHEFNIEAGVYISHLMIGVTLTMFEYPLFGVSAGYRFDF